MPKSKHRKNRPRPNPEAGDAPKPKPSPKWVPYVGVGLIAAGAIAVIVTYVAGIANWLVLLGFVVMGAGLVTLSQLR